MQRNRAERGPSAGLHAFSRGYPEVSADLGGWKQLRLGEQTPPAEPTSVLPHLPTTKKQPRLSRACRML